MAGLLDLPTELRLHIFTYLDELCYGRSETIGPNIRVTPPICRVSRTLREEALPLYAKTSAFFIQTDDNTHDILNNRLQIWLQALGEVALSKVENLQLSRHWKIGHPSRWHGHVGFYVRLQRMDNLTWHCEAGTYPMANDKRGMRLESVDLLQHIIMQRLRTSLDSHDGLSRADVEFIVVAMDVVASHPVSAFDTAQSEAERKRRRDIWMSMERRLFALAEHSKANSEDQDPVLQRSRFFTPY